jgi:hypothetical protein
VEPITKPLTRRRLLLIAGVGGVMAFLIGLRPITDVDMFWQLQLGQMMVHDGTLVAGDPFTFTHHDEAFPPLCWLAQIVYALHFPAGGWPLLQIVDNLMFAGAFMIAAFSVRSSEARSAAVAAAMILGFLVALPHNSLRPQTFALLGMALLLALRGSTWPAWSKIVVGATILLLWQNLHPSVAVAGFVLLALFVADLWEWWRGDKPGLLGVDAGLLACVAIAQFATPMGFDILAISTRNKDLSQGGPQPAIEWLPCWDPRVRAMALPSLGLAAFVTVILLLRSRFRLKAADAALLLAMAGLSAWMVRFGLFAAVVLVPVWARLIERALSPELFADKPETHGPSVALVGAVCAIGILVSASLPVLVRPDVFSPDFVPQEGMRRLRRELRDGQVYNFQPYGGPLTFSSNRRWQVLMDGRIYVYSDKEWEDYYEAARGDVPVGDLVERYHPDAFFLHPFVQRGLIEKLRKHPAWHELYDDGRSCVIFVRQEPETGVAKAPSLEITP